MRYHHTSTFGPGRRVPLDREQRAQWKARLALQRRPGGVTLGTLAVGMFLISVLGAGGELFPTQATIAAGARVDLSTAKRALAALRDYGFLDWDRRIVRAGWRVAQTSNAYVLRVPACEVHSERRVLLVERRKEEKRGLGGMTDADAVANRDRQMLALGFRPP